MKKENSIIELREQFAQVLNGKLNEQNSQFPYDMHAVREIEEIIKADSNRDAILQLLGIDKSKYNEMSEIGYENYKKNIDKKQKTIKNMFKLGFQAAIINL